MSLWTVIEAMQRRLEREGLDAEVVDAAVTRGIEALIRHYERTNGNSNGFAWAVAKA